MSAELRGIEFPPLLTGIAVPGDAYRAARDSVGTDVEPGAVFYGTDASRLDVALVLAPETPLADALPVVFAAMLGVNDAIGVLAPPEVALHLVWPDRIRVNGGLCGRLRVAASTREPDEEPDWLVVALDVPILASDGIEPGHDPDQTCLFEEGCADLTAPALVEAWARHTMSWLHVFLTEGFAPLHAEWRAKAHGLGEDVDYPEKGHFVGLDERGGMILKSDEGTRLLPLTRLLGPDGPPRSP